MVALRYARGVCRAALRATALLSLLVGCSNGRGSVEETQSQNQPATFTVGGGVSGLAGSGLLLRINGAGDLPVSANGAFTFANPLQSGAAYEVTIGAQPTNPAQTCTVSNGAGQIAGSNVTNVAIVCVANASAFAVRGVVAGLTGSGLVLRNNGGDDLAIAGDGEFSFATAVATGASYSVSVAAPPANPSQTCSIQNASGVMGGVDVTNVRVICSTNSFSIGGTVEALTGLGLVLVNNGENLAIGGNGAFTFPTRLASGAPYNVTIAAQPAGQTCTVQNAAGIVLNENVTNVTVACATNVFTIGGTVTGLAAGAQLVLRLAVGGQQDDRQITTNGRFDFAIAAPSGAGYVVRVLTQPAAPSQECVVENATGIVAGANVTNVLVSCTTRSFTIGGTVTGLAGSGLVLQQRRRFLVDRFHRQLHVSHAAGERLALQRDCRGAAVESGANLHGGVCKRHSRRRERTQCASDLCNQHVSCRRRSHWAPGRPSGAREQRSRRRRSRSPTATSSSRKESRAAARTT